MLLEDSGWGIAADCHELEGSMIEDPGRFAAGTRHLGTRSTGIINFGRIEVNDDVSAVSQDMKQ